MFEYENETENGCEYVEAEPVYSNPYAGAGANAKPAREKKRGRGFKTVALALCCSLVGGAVGAGAVGAAGALPGKTTLYESSRTPQTVEMAYVDGKTALTAAEVYAANVNSTVGVTTSITTNYWGYKTSAAAAGSGFIVSENGYIVTNYHVVEDSDSITVTTYDGTAYDASVVGYDESNDLAVLKIEASGLTPVVLGDSDALNVGDDVVAIGNPLGELTFSLTKGSVSALDREITLSSGVTMDLIQTDAAINSGNSGGALFNLYGEVVGITNAKYSGASSGEASIDNIGFAIPLNSVKAVITGIIEKGYYAKPYIGVTVKDAADAALIYTVQAGSPAEKAGLKANDIVTAANGVKIASAQDLTAAVKALSPGDALTLTVQRGESKTDVTVTVGEQKQTASQSDAQSDAQSETQQPSQSYGDGYGGGYGFGFPFDYFFGGDYNRG